MSVRDLAFTHLFCQSSICFGQLLSSFGDTFIKFIVRSLQGKLVLIGSTIGDAEVYRTPKGDMPGIEVQVRLSGDDSHW